MKKILLGTVLSLGIIGQASANAFVNGGFENGTLNSWTQNGGFVSTGPVYFPDGSNNNAVVTRTRRSEK